MRRVYKASPHVAVLPLAVAFGVGVTAVVFCILPFTHLVNKSSQTLELRKAGVLELPPPTPEDTPPPAATQPESAPEPPPAPLLADAPQQIPVSADLEVATGTGGALAGFGEGRALTKPEAVVQDTFDVSDLETRPEPVSQAAPSYPSELRKAKIEGLVTLIFILTEEGRVEEPRVENSTRIEFEKPALEAIRKWRFKPGLKEGRPVRTYIRVPMRFRVTSG